MSSLDQNWGDSFLGQRRMDNYDYWDFFVGTVKVG